ncbi:luciferin 4-monooxygenase [Scaptodrosophila lebanonensis]|uniref:Luciferin 4-monooxygenase n=1 Tax=Drosophila lebanonensis TaxID=7225 RepID=A0A6J2UJM6_DROLE|nr:luciferin 4-monooxygenase [Scaptodrosophila lebanonensis]
MADTRYDSVQKIWFGPKDKEYYGPDMTLGEVALLMFKLHADKVLQVDDSTGETLTGAQLFEQSRRLAHAFERLNLHRGDVVGISAKNTTYLTEVVVAALLSGTPINPLHPGFDEETVTYMYEITKPKIIFCDVENYETIKNVRSHLTFETEIILLSGSLSGVRNIQGLLQDGGNGYDPKTLFACPYMSGDDTAFIVSSSGVNGLPKGVARSHRSMLNNTKMPQLFTADMVLFCFSPLYWITCIFTLLASVVNGCKRIITNRPNTVDNLLDIVSRHKVTFAFTVPHSMGALAKSQRTDITEKLASLQALVCSGSKVPKAIWKRLHELVGKRFVVLYGLSEIGGVSKNLDGTVGNEGKLLRNIQVRVLDEEGNPLGPNETGHVHVRLTYRWGGYYRNPQDTQATLTPDGQWLKTGDHGYFDSDGRLHFQTRETESFKYNNFSVCPKHVEDVILHLPGVHQVAVFGVPDEISTNLVACAVVRAKNAEGEKLTADAVKNIVAEHLSDSKHIRGGVYFVNELPKTINRKLQRWKILPELKRMEINAAL